jgi:hypothetical protein
VQAEVRVGVDVRAAPAEVWRWAVDWERQGDWLPLTRVRHVGGPALAVGTRILARTGVGPVGFDDPMTLTALDAPETGPRSYEIVHTGRLVRGVGAFIVEPVGSYARFVWWERIEVPGGPVAPALWVVGGPLTRLTFGWALRRFARAVEAAPARAAVAGPPA